MTTWYTIEKSNGEYTVWFNKSNKKEQCGGYGSLGLYTSRHKKECINFIKEKGIKVEK